MVINHEKKFVFVHNPKTAGNSIQHALLGSDENSILRQGYKHVNLKHLHEEMPETRDYFSFVVIRNPWERLHSLYHYGRYKLRKEHPDADEQFELDFKTWLLKGRFVPKDDPDKRIPYQRRSQSYWCKGVSAVVRMERIDLDQTLHDRLGIYQLPHVNVNPLKPKELYWESYGDTETYAHVLKHFRWEIEFMDYRLHPQ